MAFDKLGHWINSKTIFHILFYLHRVPRCKQTRSLQCANWKQRVDETKRFGDNRPDR